ncbi:MAG: hypothetical protein SFY80_07700 [Verrucomicrobiota bacterium]|nr:hypothetical protein [Verrucomicrobiota bacterium]
MKQLALALLPFLLTCAHGASTFSPLDQAPYNISGFSVKTVANTHHIGGNLVVANKSRAAVWGSLNGMQVMALPEGLTLIESKLAALSADGTTATGTVTYQNASSVTLEAAFRWQIGSVAELMTGTGTAEAVVFPSAISANGAVIIGDSTESGSGVAFSYQAGNRTILTAPAGALIHSGEALSADGSVLAGYALFDEGSNAIAWRSGVPTRLSHGAGYSESVATAVSGNGKVIAGYALGPKISGAGTTDRAVLWNEAGEMTALVHVSGWDSAIPSALNADGTVATGYLERFDAVSGKYKYAAFIWDATAGMRTLQTELANSYGIDLSDGLGGNWSLEDARVSADSTFIYGTARDSEGVSTGFIFDTLEWRVYFRGSTVVGTNIIYCNWLSDFLYIPEYPIVWSTTHDWIYCPPGINDSYWIYDWAMDSWWWTNRTTYPYLFQLGETAESTRWLYYFREYGTHPRYFADLKVVPSVIIAYP